MELSVVICAHNEERFLSAQLDALLANQWDSQWEVVVVNNRSTDQTAMIAEQYAHRSPRVRLVSAPDRPDKAYAMAVGVRVAAGDHLAFCDADDVVAAGWVAAIGDGLRCHDVVTGPHELDLLNPAWLADSRGRSIEEPVGTFAGIYPSIRGAGWGVRRAVWERVGGVPEGYAACEDAAFSLSCWKVGIDISGVPDAVVHYRYRQSAAGLWRQGLSYGTYRPRIARLLREAGLPTPPPFGGWRSWALLVLRLPTLVTRQGRCTWVWIAGNRAGQVIGSVRERTVMV